MDEVQDIPAKANHKVAFRFRNGNLAIFALISAAMALATFWATQDMTRQVSADYAKLHAIDAVKTFNIYAGRDIGFIASAAHSTAIQDWFSDEKDPQKRKDAHTVMMNGIASLYGSSLYIGIQKTLSEYSIEARCALEDMQPHARLDPSNPKDIWYFDLMAADKDYVLNVDTDKKTRKKRVWLNHKVVSPTGDVLGAFTAAVPLAWAAEKVFSEYQDAQVRGVVIDGKGMIVMDSDFGEGEHILDTPETPVRELSSDPAFLAAVERHLTNASLHFLQRSQPTVIELSSKRNAYATIAPIESTDWSVVTLYEPFSLFDPKKLLPFATIMAALLVAFAVTSSILSYRLLFKPLGQLILNLSQLKNPSERIYGLERDDEFGILSNVIFRLLNEANHDPLTGLHNRRAMEKELQRAMDFLSRSNGLLSVLMIDVDCFKGYNDTYGHEAGDTCLKAVASVLDSTTPRAEDLVARFGGEEFVVILPSTDKIGACTVAQKLLEGMRARNLPHSANLAADRVTFSIGVTTGSVDRRMHNQDAFIKKADEALYASKQTGRNKYTWLGM